MSADHFGVYHMQDFDPNTFDPVAAADFITDTTIKVIESSREYYPQLLKVVAVLPELADVLAHYRREDLADTLRADVAQLGDIIADRFPVWLRPGKDYDLRKAVDEVKQVMVLLAKLDQTIVAIIALI